ncbi:chymotrypsin-like elastase family member 2A [Aplysia californica]|uniref:Chymotrypsin-like elastase family member 2A n=1 Tax=Aplysia californica TaxID=6500 RepID=A0ABM0ZUN2_APLCA|nr:chymotrypsin-like elastase family member 2A [Aplysia californica]
MSVVPAFGGTRQIPMKNDDRVLKAQNFIVGGKNAVINDLPYQVSILVASDGKFFLACGGSLVKKNKIVTAAHCVVSE